jgi:hypothetical protein
MLHRSIEARDRGALQNVESGAARKLLQLRAAPTYQGTGVVYDEPEQVAQYVRSQEGDGTLAAIDAEKPHACADMKVAFFMGQTGETITTSSGRWQITKILIAGVDMGRASNRYNLRSRGPLFSLKENGVPAVHLGGPFVPQR